MNSIEEKCLKKGVRLTDQRKIIAKVMAETPIDQPEKPGEPIDKICFLIDPTPEECL